MTQMWLAVPRSFCPGSKLVQLRDPMEYSICQQKTFSNLLTMQEHVEYLGLQISEPRDGELPNVTTLKRDQTYLIIQGFVDPSMLERTGMFP